MDLDKTNNQKIRTVLKHLVKSLVRSYQQSLFQVTQPQNNNKKSLLTIHQQKPKLIQNIVDKNFFIKIEKPVLKEIIIEKPYEVIIEVPKPNKIVKEVIQKKFIDNVIEKTKEKEIVEIVEKEVEVLKERKVYTNTYVNEIVENIIKVPKLETRVVE